MLLGLAYLGLSSGTGHGLSSARSARRPADRLRPCTFPTENGSYRADCGTLVVPEDRARPPVAADRAAGDPDPGPVGAPAGAGLPPQRRSGPDQHDVPRGRAAWPPSTTSCMVGYRGVDGSSVLNCPEVTVGAGELRGPAQPRRRSSAYAQAFAACAHRLERERRRPRRVHPSRDRPTTSRPLGSRSATTASTCSARAPGPGSRIIYSWRYPKQRRPLGADRGQPARQLPLQRRRSSDQQIEHYSTLCAQDPTCRAGTANLAAIDAAHGGEHAAPVAVPADQAGQRPASRRTSDWPNAIPPARRWWRRSP